MHPEAAGQATLPNPELIQLPARADLKGFQVQEDLQLESLTGQEGWLAPAVLVLVVPL